VRGLVTNSPAEGHAQNKIVRTYKYLQGFGNLAGKEIKNKNSGPKNLRDSVT
jgi:NOL1/NOP2/fmu family ribosome biogenesis protein